MNILAIGDVAGNCGLNYLLKNIDTIKKQYNIDFTVANCENVQGVGILPSEAEKIHSSGVDVITFMTNDGGTTWYGVSSILNAK